MTRYHIARDGSIARCGATVKPCPLGGQHWNSKAEAMLHAQPMEIPEALAPPAMNKFLSTNSLAKNENYANFIRSFVEGGGAGPLVKAYHNSVGEFVSRTDMVKEIESKSLQLTVESTDMSMETYLARKQEVEALRHDLYHADYAVLSARRASFREAYDAYREKNGPAVRPNFQQMVADAKAAKDAKVEQAAAERRQLWKNEETRLAARREADAKAERQQLSRVQGSKRLRNSQEDVAFSFGKRRSDPNADSMLFGEQVPAVALGSALGELVTDGKESISDFFADAGDGVRSLFHRS